MLIYIKNSLAKNRRVQYITFVSKYFNIIMKKQTGTVRTFNHRYLKIFANVSPPLQKHHQGIQKSAIKDFTWNF